MIRPFKTIRRRFHLMLGEALHGLRAGQSQLNDGATAIECLQLEPRILMSASPVAIVADVPDAAVETHGTSPLEETVPDAQAFDAVDAQSDAPASEQNNSMIQTSVELVVIDPAAKDHEQLVADLLSQSDRNYEILVLNQDDDGIAQITDALENLSDVTAIHLVSHGENGEVHLGRSVLSQQTINQYAAELITWQSAITSDADLLIYGCNLAASDSGITLTESLNTLVGMDVAASDDLTGHSSLGGDWELEVQVGVIETSIAFQAHTQETWFGVFGPAGWLYKRQLTFDNSAQTEDLVDFPVLVNLDNSNFDFSKAEANGEDLRFYDANDVTPLSYEIESWDAGAEEASIWVRVSQIDMASGTDSIWMYYGKSGATDAQDAENVWNSDYQAVWHMDETSGNHFDSTANNQDLNQQIGGVTKNATGQIAGADEFDGNNEYLRRTQPDAPLQITGDLTLEAWIWIDNYPANYTSGSGNDAAIVEFAGFGDSSSSENYLYALILQSDGDIGLGHESGVGQDHYQDMGVTLGLNQWHQVTAVRDATAKEWNLFVNGASAGGTFSYSTNATDGSNGDVYIGWDHTYFDGIIDEIRIQDTTKSADWIAAQYLSENDTFITFGTEVDLNTPPTADAGGPYVINEGDSLNLFGDGSSDPDPDTLTYKWDLDNDGNFGEAGEPIIENPTVSWATLQSFGITDDPGSPFTIGVEVNDGNGGIDTATASVTVNNVNPTGNADGGVGFSTNEDTSFTTGNVLSNDTDPNSLDVLSVSALDVTGTLGTVVNHGDGTFDYDPNGLFESLAQGQQTTDTFSYTVSDGDGGSHVAVVTVTIDGVNDTPSVDAAQSLNISETAANGTSLGTVTATDADAGATLSNWMITGGNSDGVFSIDSGSGEITVSDNTNLDYITTSSYTLSVTVSDGLSTSVVQTVAITVSPSSVPVAVNDGYVVSEGGTLSENVVGGWYNPSWKARQQIAFDNTAQAGDLLNHAVLVKLHAAAGDAVNIDYSTTQDAGQDLRFVDGDGTVLSHEIELWDEAGYSYVWVEVPQIDGGVSTDFIWMYYDHSSAGDGQNTTAVWENDDVAILHMNGNAADSSAANNDGSLVNVTAATGIIAGASSFNGTNSRVVVGSDSSLDDVFDGGGTVSAWINASTWGENGYGRIADKSSTTFGGAGNGDGWAFQVSGTGSNGRLIFEQGFSGAWGEWRTSLGTLTRNSWHHVAVVYDNSSAGNDPQFYIDGVLQAVSENRTPSGTARSDAALDLLVGNHSLASSRTFDGLIDEFRVSTTLLSADEAAAHHEAVVANFISDSPVENGPGGLLNNDSDANGDPLAVTLVSGPSNAASFTLNSDGSFNYVHDDSETTNDAFTYRVSDGVNTQDATANLSITATNDNTPVVSPAQTFNVLESAGNGTSLGIVTATDSDAGTTFTNWTITGGNADGVFGVNGATGELTVVDNTNLDHAVTSSYVLSLTVSDGTNTSAVETVAITVINVNAAPVLTPSTPQLVTIDEESFSTPATVASILATSTTDSDSASVAGIAIVGSVGNGTWEYSVNGGGTWLNVAAVSSTQSLLLRETDLVKYVGDGLAGETANLSFRAWDQTGTTAGQQGTKVNVAAFGTGGTTPFSAASDQLTLTVTDVGDVPVVTNTTTSEDTQSNTGLQITPAVSDASVTHFRLTGISNGTLFLNDGVTQVNNGSFITASEGAAGLKFTPNADYHGVTSFQVRASTDGAVSGPGLSAATTATVTVSPIADTPTVSGTTTLENAQSTSGLVILPNPADGPEVTHFKITGITSGQLFQNDGVTLINNDEFITVAAGAAGLRFTPAVDFFGTAQFQVQASLSAIPSGPGGSLATATITVTSTNQQPTAIAIPDYIGLEDDGQVTLPMAPYFSDPDGDDLTYTITVVNGTPGIFERLSIDSLNGNVTVEPNDNQFGAVDVRVTATDAEGLFVSADFTVTIQPVNDRPIVADLHYVMPAGGTLSVAAPGVLGAASDADGNPLTASIITAPGNGTIVFNPDGSFSWTPEDNYAGTASFTFIATDGTLDSSTATVTITVTGGVAPPPALAGNDSEASESESESASDGDESVAPDESVTAQPDGPSLSGSATSPSDELSQTTQSETDGAALLLLQQRDDAAFTLAAIGQVDATAAGRLEVSDLDSSNFQQHSGHDTGLNSVSGKISELAATHLRTQFYSQFSDETGAFNQTLDEFEDGIASELNFDRAVIGSVTAVGSGLAVGSVIWAVRGGLLLSGLLAQMPIWTMFDPLMVIDGVTGDEEEGDSIQDIVDRQPEKPAEPELTLGTK